MIYKRKNGSELFALDKNFQAQLAKTDNSADNVDTGDTYTAILSIECLNKCKNYILRQ